ncbi:GTP cyclohydrolase I FolE2 [Polynucleobacter paneuropaeus]|jgi:GTP cyclohydrolase I|uniref:GTP cyclohydrolase FolE2 n=1 Tax=Polynucleobacter paneuropaeus TaxID=2527775 RepID=A0AAE2YKK1_9BURK|nr:GTP cyclohydrolase FolE2 [Polynucleobacter paneuropaeus]AWW44892.1 GTP cyclohydrolase I FolE2 [Polynucleobacter paneuropaeus]AWW46654.1 GTP cyclohydrolase I FolE2 [Polynucleobacter paneuropaeus]AWW48421.1 GTP cyclohydrolase I FolE2 [Polynucleobacter paneuropaeus]MBT8516644.1 GTP cyclohydrolase I FolE2 [Polynucleobacter paneuropaeus]MBT8521406.1 GTP cyclohydrolase I FolE2 [Polynucleobacter paneuropaeus]
MNDLNAAFLKPQSMPDVQSTRDERALAIEQVGIRGVRHPLTVRSKAGSFPSVGTFEMNVALPAHVKGTHMSRFIALLQKQEAAVDSTTAVTLVREMLPLLNATEGSVQFTYTHFVKKSAPVSGVESLMDYEVTWTAQARQNVSGTLETQLHLRAVVPVMSLCPCSKEISEFGAHNQRSHVTMSVVLDPQTKMTVEDLVSAAESEASSELWGLLKRPDEKWVTEHSYSNPKFVEDLVRDVAGRLQQDQRIQSLVVEAENFESIHNHSAYAKISLTK